MSDSPPPPLPASVITVEEARARNLCRLCVKPVDPDALGVDLVTFRDGEWEFAHADCLDEQREEAARLERLAAEPLPPVSVMPAFAMSKVVEPDRVILLREPHLKGDAWEQFERELRAYLDRNPVYRDREKVVYRDRPADEDDDDHEWDEDVDDDELEEDPDMKPAPPPPWASRVAAAALAELDREGAIRIIAGSLASQIMSGSLEHLNWVEGRAARRDGGGAGEGVRAC